MDETQDLLKMASPDICASGSERALKKFKQLLKKAKNVQNMFDLLKENKNDEDIKSIKPSSLRSFKLTYDAQTNQIEPVYYWLLDFVKDAGYEIEKLTDNFVTTPGSGSFDEYGRKLGTVQEKASSYLGAINQVTKSILQLIYDLKEFEIRLEQYGAAKSKDKNKKEVGNLALKQIWLDNVDMKRGRGSIHQMSYEMGFTTLRELFMICNSVEEIKKNELANEQVKKILIPRMSEFLQWTEHSEKELKKRFEVEKSYLRTQVQTLKVYTSWVRPYLKSAEQLRQKGFDKDPALVNAFSTSMFELSFLGKSKIRLDRPFKEYKLERPYYSCLLISLTYRGHYSQRISQKGDMAYGFGGRVEITFNAYALNSQELTLFNKLREKKEREIGLSFVQEESDRALSQLQEDIDHFLEEDKKGRKEEKKKGVDLNPFSALLSIFSEGLFSSTKKVNKEIESAKDIAPDNYVETYARGEAAKNARISLYRVYDIYKKAHGLASSPEDFDVDEKEG